MTSCCARWLFAITVVCVLVSSTEFGVIAQAPPTPSLDGITALVTRLFGVGFQSPFIFSISPLNTFGNNTYHNVSQPTLHAFEIASVNQNHAISIRGSDLISLSSGLNYYLKYFCNIQARSWTETDSDGADVTYVLPSPPPVVQTNVTVRTSYEWNYYFNVCTPSYTAAWWTWVRWVRELDWMALNGVNLALAFTGQEAVIVNMYETYFGITYDELTGFLGGPAFLAWARMGNIQGSWTGPNNTGALPLSWINNQKQLQINILGRMQDLGITPVLPAFNGFVPRAFVAKYTNASVHETGQWSRFSDSHCCDLLLDPNDPWFQTLGAHFIRAQQNVYPQTVNYHLYNADTFNENRPPSNESKFLKASSAAVYQSMIAGDPNAIWIMQAWLFGDNEFWGQVQIEALLSGVPNDGMILLDMEADAKPFWNKTHSFYGKRFIWNMLHNFGGNNGLGGRMNHIVVDSVNAFHYPNSTMIGVGMTPEGIHQNYLVYELMAETFWNSHQYINTTSWMHQYVTRRYNMSLPEASSTWITLLANSSVYDAPADQHGVLKSFFELRPSLNMSHAGFMGTERWYNASDVINAVSNLLTISPQLQNNTNYLFDLVDLMRQALADHFDTIHSTLSLAYYTRDVNTALDASTAALDLYQDLDDLLLTDPHFLLGRWIAAARACATGANDTTPEFYEWNARNQITLWGPHGEIHDYAAKQWSGLIGNFYAQRYALWIRTLIFDMNAKNNPFNFNQTLFDQTSVQQEQLFQQDYNTTFPSTPSGNQIDVVKRLFNKYFGSNRDMIEVIME